MSKNILNIGIIGCSPAMGQIHMAGICDIEGVNIYALCDNARDDRLYECQKKYGATVATTDYRELLGDENLDAVIIVTPDGLHEKMTTDFLMAGKDVLCEKPMALTVEECVRMRRAEKESGRKLMIGQICRFTDNFIKAKELIDEGRIGELFFVESEYAHNYESVPGYDNWRKTPERDGFIGGGCHAVDLLRWIAGDPVEVYAIANHKCLLDWPTNDCTVALYKFPNNVSGKVFVSTGCKRPYTMRSVFYGTMGTIICDNTSDCILLYEHNESQGKNDWMHEDKAEKISAVVNNHNTKGEGEMFLDALINGKNVPITSLEGAKTVCVACATLKSAREGRPIKIEYPED